MNKKFTILTLSLLFSSMISAQEVIDNYTMSYFNKNYEIEASTGKNNNFTIYIQVNAERSKTKANYMIKSDRLNEFKEALILTKDKYVEWTKVAKENNVTDMSKDIDIKFPNIDIAWLGTKWFFSFGKKLSPKFMILKNGQNIVSFVNKNTASSNQYIDETTYWVFADVKEFEEFILKLDFDKIKVKLEKSENKAELFK
ncbi:hypothetical protein [Chryseobacterium vrystaatense]|uniref:GLPGLI family protein n=1 Tax=Chryseobacterium vrystaatense TaxID=307480 RepID=A0A1M5IHK0_9FLAO|nr:hypothetical protein [Chryseobacterium vrystaatense]SHG27529.1 hypothetical protein SAMN02787073_3867 [Chryseobacterium vrystaatense]